MKFNGKRFGAILFLALLMINLVWCFGIISAARTGDSGGDTTIYNINQEQNIVNTEIGAGRILGFFNLTGTWREIILGLVVLLIVFAALYDILELISIFQNKWVKIIIAAGLAIAAALTNLVSKITMFLLSLVATMGAIGIFIEIVICIIIFIGLAIGSNWIAKWAAKRKGQVARVKAIKSAGQAKAAIAGLRDIQTEFERKQ